MLRQFVCASLVLFAIATPSFAAAPALVARDDSGETALELSAVAIRVTVRGHLARTEYELTYRSSLDRDVGGEFRFPLPPDAEVSDLGLYFDGKLRRGVAVERVLARTAYDEIVHRRVDPALVEWSSSRAFRLDIYPIPAKGEKKVFLAYDQELTANDYELDVSYRASVPSFDVKIDADGAPTREENGVIRIARERRETAFGARSPEDGLWYASAAIDIEPPVRETAPAPHTLILYDTSASSIEQDAARVRAFLRDFLARQQAWSTADVVPFHIDLDDARRIENAGTPAGAQALERILDELHPLGATNLIAVASRLPKLAATLPPSARIVLVTDGVTSLGDSRALAAAVEKLGAMRRPVLVVHATQSPNDNLLAAAARTTGGWAIDLARVATAEAVDAAMHLPMLVRLSGPEVAPSSVLAARPARVAIAARSRDALTVLHERPLREIGDATGASMVRRAWARARLREMLATDASDEALLAHGRAFTQLTPRTSLLVLENWRDYLNWDIPMPPDVVAEKEKEEKEIAEHLAEQVRLGRLLEQAPPPAFTAGAWRVTGRVLDESSVPLPGVKVLLLDGSVPVSMTITDVNGRYALGAATAPQNPTVVADLEGFNRMSIPLQGEPPNGAPLDILLRVSAVTESITVTAAPAVPTETQTASASSLRTRVFDDDALEDPELAEAAVKQRRELRASVLERMRAISSTPERVRYYLSARKLLGGDKGFHVFAAEIFRDRSPEVAVRVLSDLAEARPEDAPMLRILARVVDGWGAEAIARLLLERAIELAPNEPQSWREIILLEARHGRTSQVAAWSKRLKAVKQNARMKEVYEQTADALARWEKASFFQRQTGVELRAEEKNDLTIELMFDTGWCYVDFHVIEPGGERVSWDQTTSASGATFTGGYTLGYGPEIYTLPRAPRGRYRISLDYYSDDETTIAAETLVHVIINRRGVRSDHFFVMGEVRENFEIATIDF